MKLYEQIRKAQERENLSVRELPRRFHVHRRDVRQALESAVPPVRKRPERLAPTLDRWKPLVDGSLEVDRSVPRKQRHTARRVWQRLVEEHGARVGESTVRRYVAETAHRRGRRRDDRIVSVDIAQPALRGRVSTGDPRRAPRVLRHRRPRLVARGPARTATRSGSAAAGLVPAGPNRLGGTHKLRAREADVVQGITHRAHGRLAVHGAGNLSRVRRRRARQPRRPATQALPALVVNNEAAPVHPAGRVQWLRPGPDRSPSSP